MKMAADRGCVYEGDEQPKIGYMYRYRLVPLLSFSMTPNLCVSRVGSCRTPTETLELQKVVPQFKVISARSCGPAKMTRRFTACHCRAPFAQTISPPQELLFDAPATRTSPQC